jgi:hypothetical protein
VLGQCYNFGEAPVGIRLTLIHKPSRRILLRVTVYSKQQTDHAVGLDPRDLADCVRGVMGNRDRKSIRLDYSFSDHARGSYEEVYVEERNHILDHIQLFAPSFGNEMEKMKYPTIVIWLMGHSDLQRAWTIVFDQWIG